MEEKGKMNWGWAVKRSPEQYWEEELSEEETALHVRNCNREDRVEELNFEE
jgi:predicted ATPase